MRVLSPVFFMILFFSGYDLRSQTTPNPFEFTVITYDTATKKATPKIPFDRIFILEVADVISNGTTRAEAYEMVFKKTRREFKFVQGMAQAIKLEVREEKDKLRIIFPPVAPNKDFDVLIYRSITGSNVKRADKVNQLMYQLPDDPQDADFTDSMKEAFKELKDSINKVDTNRLLFGLSKAEYFSQVVIPAKQHYNKLMSSYTLPSFPDSAEITHIQSYLPVKGQSFEDINILSRIIIDNLQQQITDGNIPMQKSGIVKVAGPLDYEKRITYLSASISYFDSLTSLLDEIVIDHPALLSVRTKIKAIRDNLITNKKDIEDCKKKILKAISKLEEGYWLNGTTKNSDLQTKGASIFTIDAGLTNILAWDNRNTIVYIPKVYWGLNIYFRAVDKNVNLKSLGKSPDRIPIKQRGLLAHRSVWHRWCLSIGLTLGNMANSQFDNFYNNSSLTIGPSYRFAQAFRIGGGVALLRRNQENPIKSKKEITAGPYLSLSVDIDLLKTLDKITGIIFK